MFTGFTPETIDFLWGIRMNNNRDWFLEHKGQYVDTLYEPMKALGAQLYQPFLERTGDILKVSRIYRDARLHHPDPYKESLWISIRRESDWWAEHPCLFFEITPDGVNYGFSLWKPKIAAMESFRARITAQPQEFLEVLHRVQDAVGMAVTAECYKRSKPAPDPALQPYFDWRRDVGLIVHEDVGPEIFGPQLGQRAEQFLVKLIPLYDYFNLITLG